MDIPTDIDLPEIYAFLDDLRDSGLINMMGAAPSIMLEFEVNRHVSRKILMKWINKDKERMAFFKGDS